jgi:hypothetical protein
VTEPAQVQPRHRDGFAEAAVGHTDKRNAAEQCSRFDGGQLPPQGHVSFQHDAVSFDHHISVNVVFGHVGVLDAVVGIVELYQPLSEFERSMTEPAVRPHSQIHGRHRAGHDAGCQHSHGCLLAGEAVLRIGGEADSASVSALVPAPFDAKVCFPHWSSHDPADYLSPSASHSSTTVEAVVNLTL